VSTLQNEPVIAGFGVTALYAAVIGFLTAFEIWAPTDAQYQALIGLIIPIAGIVAY
jgi:hypothetical protein